MAENDTADFERLLHDLEYENQQYLKEIQKEEQTIKYLRTAIENLEQDLEGERRMTPYLDHSVKAYHRLYTCNRNMANNLKTGLESRKTEEEALCRELEELAEMTEKEILEHDEILQSYEVRWQDYQEAYESLPLAKQLAESEKEKNQLLAQHEKKIKELDQLKQQKQAMENRFHPSTTWIDFTVKFARLMLDALQLKERIPILEKTCATLQEEIKCKQQESKNTQQQETSKMCEGEGDQVKRPEEPSIRDGEQWGSGSEELGMAEEEQEEARELQEEQQTTVQEGQSMLEEQRNEEERSSTKQQRIQDTEALEVELDDKQTKNTTTRSNLPVRPSAIQIEIPRLCVPSLNPSVSSQSNPAGVFQHPPSRPLPSVPLAVPVFKQPSAKVTVGKTQPQSPYVCQLNPRPNRPEILPRCPTLTVSPSNMMRMTDGNQLPCRTSFTSKPVNVPAAPLTSSRDVVTSQPQTEGQEQRQSVTGQRSSTPVNPPTGSPGPDESEALDIEGQLRKIKLLGKHSPGFRYAPGQHRYTESSDAERQEKEMDNSELFDFSQGQQFFQPLFADTSKPSSSQSAERNSPTTSFGFDGSAVGGDPSDTHASVLTLFGGDGQADARLEADDTSSEQSFFSFVNSAPEDEGGFGSTTFSLF